MFRKVLIANRGEIAIRIAQTLQQMGIRAVAVHSDADRRSPHVRVADEAYGLSGNASVETYLRGDKIIEIARRAGAEAIHPGYGFLSENATFAQACADAGLTFIGPRPEVVRLLGDKLAAKEACIKAGVPVVPGWAGDLDAPIETLKKEAKAIGYPILVKAAAGGGGKGMRIVERESELESAVAACQREAASSFSDGRVFLEKYLTRPRHVEFQIFGDAHGNVVHLFERECSIQRRYQKIIEESPSPALTPDLRRRMGDAAVRIAAAVGYTNAGTVEFMLDESGAFYFLEVNTRLQVEHPVTEEVTRQDLVRAQILVAAGAPLPFRQDELHQLGHALECRVYAEDPEKGFLPSTGRLRHYVPPVGPGIRVDGGVTQGSDVTVYYDPMLAKLTAWGRSREESIARMIWALERFVVMGVRTNVELLRRIVGHREFQAGRLHTRFLEEHGRALLDVEPVPDEAFLAAALAAAAPGGAAASAGDRRESSPALRLSPWMATGSWRAF